MCHGPEGPTFTPSEIFNLGTGFLNFSLSEVISATDYMALTWMMWLSLLMPSWGTSTLVLWLDPCKQSFCLFPPFFWWPMLIYLPLANLFFLLSTCLWHHTWVTALWPRLLYRFSVSLGLSACCYQVLKKLGAIKGEFWQIWRTVYWKGQTEFVCNER